MFKIGEKYIVKMREHESETAEGGTVEHYNCEVIEVEGNLVTFRQNNKEWILNTVSTDFVSASLQ